MKHHIMRRSVIEAGLLAALCALSTSSALADFSNIIETPWYGGTHHYYGNTQITSGGVFNNSSALDAYFTALPADTGPLYGWDLTPGVTISGDYYYGLGVLVQNNSSLVINNNAGGSMQGVVAGSGQAFAAGVYGLPQNGSSLTLNNSGIMDGQVQNNDGSAGGVYVAGAANVYNNAGATMSATASYYTTSIYATGGSLYIVNNGTMKSTSTGGTQGDQSGKAYGSAVNLFTYSADGSAPIYFENNGTVNSRCTGGITNWIRGVSQWGEGSSVIFKNTGTISESVVDATSSNCESDGVYVGADNGDVRFYNSGTITQDSTNSGFAVGLENDSSVGDMWMNNSGTISSAAPFAVMMGNYSGNASGHCYVSNSGTISGGWLGLGWVGPMTFYDSGDIHTVLSWLSNGDTDVYITGLPTIDPELGASSGHTNNLIFNLTGTLQYVNGTPASGNDLSAFSLGSQGNIVVSGKTYRWNNFTSVSGRVSDANIPYGAVRLVVRHSGKALCPYAGRTANGTQMHQWTYLGGTDQQFIISPDNGYYKIIGVQSGKAVEVSGGNTSNGSKVQLWDYYGLPWQKFSFKPTDNGYFQIVPSHAPNSCLDVSGISTDDGALVQLWGQWGGANQQWLIESTSPVVTINKPFIGAARAVVTINATDSTSAVTNIYFTDNGGAVQTYNGPYTTYVYGQHTIDAWAVNKTGNVSAHKSISFTIKYPTPVLNAVAPDAFAAGDTDGTLVIKGDKFSPASQVLWNGTALTTTYISSYRLSAVVPTALIKSPGTASITVTNPDATSSAAQTISIVPLAITSVDLPTNTVIGGTKITDPVVRLNVAVNSPVTVNLTSDNPAAVPAATAIIRAGNNKTVFSIRTRAVTMGTTAKITARLGTSTQSNTLAIIP